MSPVFIFEPNSFLCLEGFSEHPMCKDRVCHDGEKYLLGQLEEVVLVESCAGDDCRADTFASVLEFAPIIFLRDEGDIVDHHEVQERINELRAVGAMIVSVASIQRNWNQTYMLNDMNSLTSLSGSKDATSNERLKPPKPPDICSKRCSAV